MKIRQEINKNERKKTPFQIIRIIKAEFSGNQQALKKVTNPKLVEQIQEVKNWEKKVESFQIEKPTQEQYKKNKGTYQKKNTQHEHQSKEGGNQQFNRGAKYDPKRQQPTASAGFDIKIGKKGKNQKQKRIIQNLSEKNHDRIISNLNQKYYSQVVELKKEEQKPFSLLELEIENFLDKITPQNVKQISRQIERYVLMNKQICHTLVEFIIQKSWKQPKYAAFYAKLCNYCCEIDIKNFQFGDKKNKNNEFKQFLIERVQQIFNKKQQPIPQNKSDPQKYLTQIKNKIMGITNFIAQLIKIKIIQNDMIKYCIAILLKRFLEGRYNYIIEKKTQNNFYEFYFEVIIQFLENLAQNFTQNFYRKSKQYQQSILKQVISICEFKIKPKQIYGLQKLRPHLYYDLLELISDKMLKQSKEGERLNILFKNLIERKNNFWGISPSERARLYLIQVNYKMNNIFHKFCTKDSQELALEQFAQIYKNCTLDVFIEAFMLQVSNDISSLIKIRLKLFDIFLDKYLGNNNLLGVWRKIFKNLSKQSKIFPFCSAAIAQVLIKYTHHKKSSYIDFFIEYDQDEQKEEYLFMDEIFQKLYFYTKDEKLLKLITPKEKQQNALQ